MIRWIGLWALAVSWLTQVSFFENQPAAGWGLGLLVGSAAVLASERGERLEWKRGWLLGCVALIPAFDLPAGYGWGAALAAVAGALAALRHPRARRAAGPVSRLACVLLLQGALVAAFFRFSPHVHALPWLLRPFEFLLEALGAPAHTVGGELVSPQTDFVFRFQPTLEALGGLPLVLMLAPGLALGSTAFLRRPLTVVAVVTAYAALRFALVSGFVMDSSNSTWLWDPAATGVTLLELEAQLRLEQRGETGHRAPHPGVRGEAATRPPGRRRPR